MKKTIKPLWLLMAAVGGAVAAAGNSQAATLSGDMTADNAFTAYLSTDDNLAGVQIGAGADWPNTYAVNGALIPGVVNYLHVSATNWGGPASLIGDFTISDKSFVFANGSQHLTTNTADWRVYTAGFGNGLTTTTGWGGNGGYPWGPRPNIDSDATWIWTPDYTAGAAFFSTAVQPVPAPATLLLLGSGVASLTGARLRKKNG